MKSLVFAALALTALAFTNSDKLVGTWQGTSSILGTYRLVFNTDNSFELSVNDKPRVSGTYSLTDSIFTMEDYGCPGVTGKYKLNFTANGDSCRFTLLDDGCDGRAANADNAYIYRVK